MIKMKYKEVKDKIEKAGKICERVMDMALI